MRGCPTRKGPLIRPFGPPSPRWGEEGAKQRASLHRSAVVERAKFRPNRIPCLQKQTGYPVYTSPIYSFGLLSTTRRALPTERSIVSGAWMVTATEMPIVSLMRSISRRE